VLALGDMVQVGAADGTIVPLPGLAPVAIQQGRYAARVIRKRLRGRPPAPFHYADKGNLATIGRSKAVADVRGIHLAGFPAWTMWLLVHLYYLIGFQNRLLVLLRWTISFVTRGRGARLIVARPRVERETRLSILGGQSTRAEANGDPERNSEPSFGYPGGDGGERRRPHRDRPDVEPALRAGLPRVADRSSDGARRLA
jgi:hypothetical protein